MCKKWDELRPDMKLSKTALSTKGKRLFDRANAGITPVNAWLSKNDLDALIGKINEDMNGYSETRVNPL